jgi:polyphosphate kinase
VGLKTHGKLLLVTRREARKDSKSGNADTELVRYAHLSTGNYNPRTARLYTDMGMLTADAGMTADVETVFLQLASQTKAKASRHLVTAPFALHAKLCSHVAQVAAAARRGKASRIVIKINALTDQPLIAALVKASQAGVRIDLIVRGACMLPPGVPGHTDNIRVRSVVGRFLEHSRIFYFSWGPQADEQVLYLSSADWMGRNMFRRVEVAWPVRDATLRQRVIDEALVPYLHDQLDAWQLDGAGRYKRVAEQGLSAQQALVRRFS